MAKLTKKQKEAYAKVDSSKSYDLAAASALVTTGGTKLGIIMARAKCADV